MTQNNLASDDSKSQPEFQQRGWPTLELVHLKRKRLKSRRFSLRLSNFEKRFLIVSFVLTIGLMFFLVSTKVTNNTYQHQIVAVNSKLSRYHDLNNNSRQRISYLQRNTRLQKVAHHDHLKLLSRNVRNVK